MLQARVGNECMSWLPVCPAPSVETPKADPATKDHPARERKHGRQWGINTEGSQSNKPPQDGMWRCLPKSSSTENHVFLPSCAHSCFMPAFFRPSRQRMQKETSNTKGSLVVTDPATSLALTGLSNGERTGSRVFQWVWPLVIIGCWCDVHIGTASRKICMRLLGQKL